MNRYAMAVLVALMASGCTDAMPASDAQAMDVVQSLRYARDRHGNCLAFVMSQTYYGYQVVAVTQVDKGCQEEAGYIPEPHTGQSPVEWIQNAANDAAQAVATQGAEIARLRTALEWQPIETAPKDRTILGWFP